MNILLFSIPDSFEHLPTIAIRIPNGALTSLAGNVDPHHRVAAADLLELTKAGVLLAGEGLQPSSLRQMPPRQVLKSMPGSEA